MQDVILCKMPKSCIKGKFCNKNIIGKNGTEDVEISFMNFAG